MQEKSLCWILAWSDLLGWQLSLNTKKTPQTGVKLKSWSYLHCITRIATCLLLFKSDILDNQFSVIKCFLTPESVMGDIEEFGSSFQSYTFAWINVDCIRRWNGGPDEIIKLVYVLCFGRHASSVWGYGFQMYWFRTLVNGLHFDEKKFLDRIRLKTQVVSSDFDIS